MEEEWRSEETGKVKLLGVLGQVEDEDLEELLVCICSWKWHGRGGGHEAVNCDVGVTQQEIPALDYLDAASAWKPCQCESKPCLGASPSCGSQVGHRATA